MPFVLQQGNTSQIFTCSLVNHYGLAYYGVKFWNDEEEAAEQRTQALQSAGLIDFDSWNVIELEEGEMKLCNVKLRNNPIYQLYWSDARKPEVRMRGN